MSSKRAQGDGGHCLDIGGGGDLVHWAVVWVVSGGRQIVGGLLDRWRGEEEMRILTPETYHGRDDVASGK